MKKKTVVVPPPPKYVTDKFLAARYQVSRATIWNWKVSGRLPPPERLSENVTRWRLDEIEECDRARAAGRALPSAADAA